jgi:hypothetical protein
MSITHPKALRSGRMKIGSWEVDCHVLEDERRVITQRSFLQLIDFKGRGNDLGHRMTYFFNHPALKSKKISDLVLAIKSPFYFRPAGGPVIAYGYEGSIVVDYCVALLKAHRQGLIEGEVADRYAVAAENLVLSVAKVGIVALIDEATGYQEIRPRQALQAILDKYLLDHGARWAKRFPDDFYIEMFRLKKWDWKGMAVNRPSVVGHYTNDLIYMRLAPAILEELQKRNPAEDGKRKQKHHQWLTDDVGHPKLEQHLHTILAFMKVAKDWGSLCRMVDKAFPKIGHSFLLDLGEDFTEKEKGG